MDKEERYCIIKHLVLENGRTQPVIMVDSGSEVMEWEDKKEVTRIALAMEKLSDKGFKYTVKTI